MIRPAVSVVMPFAGSDVAARAAVAALLALEVRDTDELILVDNRRAPVPAPGLAAERIRVVRADRELSPAHARNVGAASAKLDWILFLDSDCRAEPGLLDAFFSAHIGDQVGALAGEIVPRPESRRLASRYAAARSFLGQRAHLAHPYMPRAAAANLLVRRSAFTALGGFFEGLRAAEDTDFSWRLQDGGWKLELRPEARAVHEYRSSVRELRSQWRGYAAGRAWLARRYEGFHPEPALLRALRARRRRAALWSAPASAPRAAPSSGRARAERPLFLLIDGVLAVEELVGFTLSNRPAPSPALTGRDDGAGVQAVLLVERFPVPGDPLVELAATIERVRVQAASRPDAIVWGSSADHQVDYLEDDGIAVRLLALVWLCARHPIRAILDRALAGREPPRLRALAPAVRRLDREPQARVMTLGPAGRRTTAGRIARLAGRPPAGADGRHGRWAAWR